MNKITFELTVDEANVVLQALGNMPFVQVAGLIQNLRTQAEPQVSQATVATPTAEVE